MSGEEEDVQVAVRFVIPRGKSEVTVTEALSQAFEESREAGLEPAWVPEDDILQLVPTKTVSLNLIVINSLIYLIACIPAFICLLTFRMCL